VQFTRKKLERTDSSKDHVKQHAELKKNKAIKKKLATEEVKECNR
jgi:hypothetical protein